MTKNNSWRKAMRQSNQKLDAWVLKRKRLEEKRAKQKQKIDAAWASIKSAVAAEKIEPQEN